MFKTMYISQSGKSFNIGIESIRLCVNSLMQSYMFFHAGPSPPSGVVQSII